MLSRLGNVLYWLGCVIAAPFAAAAIYMQLLGNLTPNDKIVPLFLAGIAIIVWVVGRALRYVLADR
jgi:hypothetical protein